MTFRVFSDSIHCVNSTYLQQRNGTPFLIFVKLHAKYYSLLYTAQNIPRNMSHTPDWATTLLPILTSTELSHMFACVAKYHW